MLFRPNPKDADPKERALWGDLLSLGMVFPVAILLGYLLGRWVGNRIGYPRIGLFVGLAWGALTGFWELYKVAQRMDRLDRDHQDPPGGSHDP